MRNGARRVLRSRPTWMLALFLLLVMRAPVTRAQDHESMVREAAKHFRRGVALYSEADYRSAVVEFRRAYTLVPNTATLYNVGEAQYQLLDYAAALTTFEQYLAEASPIDSHYAEVQRNVDVLKARVGRVTITTNPAGADVAVDDVAAGTTPLDKPVVVNIGRRKVAAVITGRVPLVRYLDVAAEDNIALALELPLATLGAPVQQPFAGETLRSTPSGTSGSGLRVAGVVTAVALGAGALTFGALALSRANALKSDREAFPVSESVLAHDAKLTRTYSIIADSLGAAALVVGGVTLYSMLSSSPAPRSAISGARLSVGLGTASFETRF